MIYSDTPAYRPAKGKPCDSQGFPILGVAARPGGGFCSREADDVDRDGRRPLCGGTGVVDDMVDGADPTERDGEQVVQLDAGCRCVGNLEATGGVDRRVDVEEAVPTSPK